MMGRFTRTKKGKVKAEVADCIFPKGIEAGIICVTVTKVVIDGRKVRVCNSNGCTYNETPLF